MVTGASELGITLSDSQVRLFEVYLAEILAWNRRRNIVSRKDEGRIGAYHFIDSLSAYGLLPENAGFRCLDVGSGAGFPGIPLKIVRPDMILGLAEPKRWRYLFLQRVIEELALSDTTLHRMRVEDLSPGEAEFDTVLVRSVASLKAIVPLTLPRLSAGGALIAYKSGDVSVETNEAMNVIAEEDGKVRVVLNITLPLTGVHRTLVAIEKSPCSA